MQAVFTGDLDEVKLLVSRNSDVGEKNQVFENMSPLQLAVFFNDLKTVEYLARKGASVSEPDSLKVHHWNERH